MEKKFIRLVSLIICVAMAVTLLLVFCLQTHASYQRVQADLENQLDTVENVLAENSAQIDELRESTGEDYIVRTRAFSYMIQQNPELLDAPEQLQAIQTLLDVDELHVTDEKGVIRWGTVPDYIGFDFSGSEQAGVFMDILRDRSLEIAQEPQPNGAEGVLFQYVGTARKDAAGIVQIGMQPTRLETALQHNTIDKILLRFQETDGGIFALSADGTVVWHPDSALIGQNIRDAGLSVSMDKLSGSTQTATINGSRFRLSARAVDDYIIVAYQTLRSALSGRNTQLLVLLISDILVILIMVVAIRLLLRRQIVQPMQQLMSDLKQIEGGALDTRIEIHASPEFTVLSDGINAMVSSIRDKIQQTQRLLAQQQTAASRVKQVTQKLQVLSNSNLSTADELTRGSAEQTSAIEQLAGHIDGLAGQMENDNRQAALAGRTSAEAGESLEQGVEALRNLSDCMDEMNHMSDKIQKIVNAINDISMQTDILALNAAVEASRAGTAGKGFSVVAEEVRNLAGKSAESAQQTADMIGHTVEVMKAGKSISAKAGLLIETAMQKSKEANRLTGTIIEASDRQSQAVQAIRDTGAQVGQVAQDNARLAEASREGVSQLLTEIQRLQELSQLDN